MPSRELYRRIKKEIDSIPVVNMHEHMAIPEEDYLEYEADFARFLYWYTIDDLQSAGMAIPEYNEYRETLGAVLRIDGKILSHDEKWRYIKPYWENARYTGYCRAALLSMKKLLGVDDLNDETYGEVTEKLSALMKPGLYRSILKDVCGFPFILNDVDTMVTPETEDRIDRSLFHFVSRFRHFTYAYLTGGIEYLEERFGRTVRNIDHLLDVMDAQFDRWVSDDRRIAIKCADAYTRNLYFEDSTRDEAERVMRRIFTMGRNPHFEEVMSFTEARPFENFVMHRVLDRAEAHGIPVIFHTGIQTHMGNTLGNSRATLLTNLFLKYPKLRFHLLHSSYPWMQEAACLAKQFANVSLDLTWVQIIVPEGAREGLTHMLDTVPVNKIHAFGGDAMSPETIWGALEVARENVAHVLAGKIETGHMTEVQAAAVAEKLMNGNARSIFPFES